MGGWIAAFTSGTGLLGEDTEARDLDFASSNEVLFDEVKDCFDDSLGVTMGNFCLSGRGGNEFSFVHLGGYIETTPVS